MVVRDAKYNKVHLIATTFISIFIEGVRIRESEYRVHYSKYKIESSSVSVTYLGDPGSRPG